jgi:hypothetical protein
VEFEYILWTGDTQTHKEWDQDQSTQMNNTIKATEEIKRVFPDKPMFPIFGNHEFYPCDQEDFTFSSQNRVKEISADIWQSYLTEDA